ncbi:diiron oxygenase [Ralstonia solanacearum]|uniref:diiron oxygenase n=1 Tax=Ralstonia solanacearum TaxID=305 RepID=UPI00078C7A7D|nr:diiron oxygenase [Ralstonia solanacearum]AMP39872.1 P-aminobenzoate N-oxygenase AurF family protein [Ralstonia solanacearum]AXV88715.1 P-aminobenzoate N-oxygenase AurF family protein [Ralstonia solanacearum]AXW08187.1 P-aminobenzoate N-oxygenase AurF family protein [Ralstonia solanacearum]AXW25977.1 P-aminobenzoate N-oxygenase AurF family protein [Ralstonia solanacearum]AXW82887.1 P-aminobenzoate N-oxygenase AurF family protein [Ralstonia solanacearum]
MIAADYCSPFHDWHEAAAVRSMAPGTWLVGPPGAWMADDEGSVLAHPALDGERRNRVAAGLLVAHLGFTVALENELISPVARDIAARRLGATYDDRVVADALRVQCDEAYHAVLAQELMAQVTAMTGAGCPRYAHGFLLHVDRLVSTVPRVNPALLRFSAAVVAETLITKTLRDDWLDDGLQHDVRVFLHHHYVDEARHSAYFAQLLRLAWPQWPAGIREAIRPLWSGLIDAFLAPDAFVVRDALKDAGLRADEIARVMSEAARPEDAARRRHRSARHTLHALRSAGALEEHGSIRAVVLGEA